MPSTIPRVPKYRHYKPKDLAVVRIDGKDHYLGKFGSEESHERYRRLIAETLASPIAGASPASPTRPEPGRTINELLVAYWERRVSTYYVKDGRPTSEQDNTRQALRFVRTLYGSTAVADFGPLALKAVRQTMIDADRCRTLINKDINRVRGMFRWAAEEELYPGDAYQALKSVAGLAKDRSSARERPPVGPVDIATVNATLPFLSATVAAMVRLQYLTGARPGEVMSLRPRDVDRSGEDAWVYRPGSHKTEHHGRGRTISLGPRAQRILKRWLDRSPESYCFSPVEAVAARRGNLAVLRPSPAETAPTVSRSKAKREPGPRYTKDSYRWAIRRACLRAGVEPWSPHRLRHTRATQIRKKYGIEAAQVILGHAKADTTEIYAERDLNKARQVMDHIG